MKSKGQFMIISAIIAGILVITLSSAISTIQNHTYDTVELPEHLNQLRHEAERITADGTITQQERRNFRKMTTYIENYRTTVSFDNSVPCVEVTLQNTEQRVDTPCMN